MRLPRLASVLLIFVAQGAAAQSLAQNTFGSLIDVTYAVSFAGGGWDFAESQRRVGVGLEVPISGSLTGWGAVSKMELNNVVTCALECYVVGDPYFVQIGLGYRAFQMLPHFSPFLGAGVGLRRWSERGHQWHPSVRGGFDVSLVDQVALRVAAESEWATPGRLTSGLVVRIR